jgi:hypothetical protein
MPHLEALVISVNSLMDDGVDAIIEACPDTIRTLDFSLTRMTSEALVTISENIPRL